MKKQLNPYSVMRYKGEPIKARREISYEIKLTTRLLLDELCFQWNKQRLEKAINGALDNEDRQLFYELSNEYRKTFRE